MTIHPRSVAIFVASVAVGSSLPLMVAGQSMTGMSPSQSVTFQMHTAPSGRDRIDYGRALEIYKNLLQLGKTGLVAPDINKRETIDVYLNSYSTDIRVDLGDKSTVPLSTKDYVAPASDVVDMSALLSQQERDALLRSEKVGKCWSYPGFSQNYYTLCNKFIKGKKEVSTSGQGNDIQTGRILGKSYLSAASSAGPVPSTVKDYRFQQMSSAMPKNHRALRMMMRSSSSK